MHSTNLIIMTVQLAYYSFFTLNNTNALSKNSPRKITIRDDFCYEFSICCESLYDVKVSVFLFPLCALVRFYGTICKKLLSACRLKKNRNQTRDYMYQVY